MHYSSGNVYIIILFVFFGSCTILQVLYDSNIADDIQCIILCSCTVHHVLQSECHPLLSQWELRKFCESHGIVFQAYSSLGTGDVCMRTPNTACS